MIAKVVDINKKVSIPTKIFSDLKGNPFGSHVQKGVEQFKNGKHDGVIAFGGGSSLDVGKSIALLESNDRPLWDFSGEGNFWKENNYIESMAKNKMSNPNNVKPIIAIPTTAGTGSEASRAAAIINEKTNVKKIVFHPRMLPTLTILDPELTIGLPKFLTAATGMDAFTHCAEAYLVDSFHPMADALAVEGMKMIVANLPKVLDEPGNLDARGKMLLAASMGATAFQKGLGMIHSMAHPLSAEFNIHHGLANALLIKFGMEFTIAKTLETSNQALMEKLNLIGNIILNSTTEDIALLPENLNNFIHNLGISGGLEQHGILPNHIPKLAQLAFEDSCHATHPFPVSIEDFHAVYTRAL